MYDSSLKVLLIEDNPGDARLIHETLKETKTAQYEMGWVDTLSQGLVQLAEEAIDVVLLDLSLPDSHGLETLEKILPPSKEVPIVVLTGLDDEELAIHALRNGAQDYLIKGNVNCALLGRSIRYAMERKRAEVALQKAHDTLEERVRDRTDAFVKQNKKLLKEIEERRHAENLYQTLAEKSMAGVYIVQDRIFRYLNCNAAAYAGYTPKELIGREAYCIVHPEDRKSVKLRAGQMLKGERDAPYEFRIRTRDGRERWILETVTSTVYEGTPAILGNSMDVTDMKTAEVNMRESHQLLIQRKQAEEERWESEHRYHVLFDHSPMGVFHYDTDLRVTDCNEAAASILKVTGKDIIGFDMKSINDRSLMPALSAPLKGNRGVFQGFYRATVSQAELWLSLRTAPLYRPDGTIDGCVAIAEDITERVQARHSLEESKEALEIKTRSLEESNTALRILFEQMEKNRQEIQWNVLYNVKHLIFPYIEKLRVCRTNSDRDICLQVLETNLKNIISPFLRHMTLSHYKLTPKELNVANLIKEGKTNKEIAELLYLSIRSVEFHRDNIRNKLGLKNKKMNLQSFLSSLT